MSVPYIEPATLARIVPGLALNPNVRGYVPAYHGAETRCPCCARTNWLVGRLLVECAFCSTALPIAEAA